MMDTFNQASTFDDDIGNHYLLITEFNYRAIEHDNDLFLRLPAAFVGFQGIVYTTTHNTF